MLKNIEAVIFDLDGTLVDSMNVWKKLDIDYLEQNGINIPNDFSDEIEGMSITEKAVYVKERFNVEGDAESIKRQWHKMIEGHYRKDIKLKNGVKEFFELLKLKNIKMSIASSNSKELIEIALKTHGLDKYISHITTSCEVKKGKPAPDVYIESARKLGVREVNCLVFEDVPNGIRAAKNAGMKCCAVYDDFSKDMDDLKKELADYYIYDYDDLKKMYA